MVQLYAVQFARADLIWRAGRNASSQDWAFFRKGNIVLVKGEAEGGSFVGLKLEIPDGVNTEVNVCDKVKFSLCAC